MRAKDAPAKPASAMVSIAEATICARRAVSMKVRSGLGPYASGRFPRPPGLARWPHPVVRARSAGGRAVAALPSRALGDGGPQVAAVDVWPEAGGEEQFGVRGVPGEEVGGALLGAGTP